MPSTELVGVKPGIVPDLDPAFLPAALFHRAFDAAVAASGGPSIAFALEHADGSVYRWTTGALPDAHPDAHHNFVNLERQVKFLLWSRGAYRIYVQAPGGLTKQLQQHFAHTETGAFDQDIMGRRVFERPFEIVAVGPGELPAEKVRSVPLGRHLSGCRIGFDLGASDRKAAAVVDGEVVFSEEIDWNPVPQANPQWHYDQIMDSLKRAAAHLPRVDAIGGSSAGVIVQNHVKLATLFRGVPPDEFARRVKGLFLEIKAAWGGIPFEIVNDGEVTALAGSMSLGDNAVLGVALGSSQAAGYVTPEGNITPWLNELAFAPVDYQPEAPADEWSKDVGCGVQYFSQQAVGRLAPTAGLSFPEEMSLPERLKEVQALMARGDERALKIYRTLGAYLGYGLAHYARFYPMRHALVLGRVTTGGGGDLMLDRAREVLTIDFPELADRLALHMPDEKNKRHGQAIAAASLPAVGS